MSFTGSGHDVAPSGEPPDGAAADPSIPGDLSGEVLTTAHAQARVRAEAGDLTGARTLLEDALAAVELQHGRDHPQLAPLMVDLATIARNVGNLTEAQNQLRRAYGIVVSAAGPEHATSLSIEGRLAAVNYRLGEPTEAYDWHIADVGARVLGDEHPAVRGAQQRLAALVVHEEQTPPTEPPAMWQQSYAGSGFAAPPAGEEGGGWAPGYAGYIPSPTDPGIYDRALPTTGFYLAEPPRPAYQQIAVYPEPPLVESGRRRGHAGGVALVTSFGLAIIVAAAVIAYQLFGAHSASTAASPPTKPSQVTSQATTSTPAPSTSTSASAGSASGAPSGGPSTSPYGGLGLPPGGVTLQDNGGSVVVEWLDPSSGDVPFIVAYGRTGQPPAPKATVPAGRTMQTIYGLNPQYNYCFTVAAVWSADLVETSDQTCTKRALKPATA